MRQLIYNVQGTGVSTRQIRRLENTQPGPGTYLEGDMRGHLGDEIMLLDGLHGEHDELALEGLGYVGAGNYRSRAIDLDGFALSEAELSIDRRAGRDFRPWGLAEPPEVSPARVAMLKHPDRFIGPTFYPLEDAGRRAGRDFRPWGLAEANFDRRAGRDFRPWGLAEAERYAEQLPPPATWLDGFSVGAWDYEAWPNTPPPGTWLQGFGDAAADRASALATANSIRNACRAACGLINETRRVGDQMVPDPEATARVRAQCQSGCDLVYSSAEAAINAAIRPGTPPGTPTTPEQQAIIQAKLDALARAQQQAAAGQTPAVSTGLTTNQMLMIGGGVVVLGLLAVVALRK